MYNKALAVGAKGGKLLGAGGGGFLLFYCDEGRQQCVREALGLEQTYFSIDSYGSRVVYFA
jgi:D-glycero-alpha-D-manno-heptose-7-phosphate kinase